MKPLMALLSCAILSGVLGQTAPQGNSRAESEAKIRAIAATYQTAYTEHDAARYGALFTEDVDAIILDNRHTVGRDSMMRDQIAFWKSSPGVGMNLAVNSIQFITPDVAVVNFTRRGEFQNRGTWVVKNHGGHWLIAAIRVMPAQADGPAGSVSPESGFASVSGGRLYYETAGAGESVVLIHGNEGDRRHWDHQFDTIAKEFRVVCYDVRGFGKSSCPAVGEVYAHHTDLAALLDHLQIRAAHIAGWSMGSAITVDFALAHPDRTKSLIAVGPWVSGFSSPSAMGMFGEMRKIREVFDKEGQAPAVAAWMKTPFFAATVRDPAASAAFERIARDFTFCAFLANDPQPLQPAAAGRLGEIRVPTLILTAEHDVPACVEVADLLARSIPGSKKIVMAGTGHLLHMEKPTEFNEHVAEFVRSVSGR